MISIYEKPTLKIKLEKSIMLSFLLCSGSTNASFDMSQAFPWKNLSGSEEFPEIFNFRPKMYQNK